MKFEEIMRRFNQHKGNLKTVSVASLDGGGKPNSAHKMLIDVVPPDHVYFLDYPFTRTYANLKKNESVSLSYMDDLDFVGYKFNGPVEILESGNVYEDVKARWEARLLSHEAGRILARMKGQYSAREAENALPKGYVIARLAVHEASVIRPSHIHRAKSDRRKKSRKTDRRRKNQED